VVSVRSLRPAAPQRAFELGAQAAPAPKKDPDLLDALDALMVDETAGDPQTDLKWSRKSLRAIGRSLTQQGHPLCPTTARRLLLERGYALRVNRKQLTHQHQPERDAQFRHIVRKRRAFLRAGWPVLSADTKKRELVGKFKRAGRSWRKEPIDVNIYDFPHLAEGVAIPYGIYDVGRDEGMVAVGVTHDSPELAVNVLRAWWRQIGRRDYPRAERVLLEVD